MNILVIEQDESICNSLKDVLEDWGCNVTLASTQEAALFLLKKTFCLTILDHYTFEKFNLNFSDIQKQNIVVISTFYYKIESIFPSKDFKSMKKPFNINELLEHCK